MVQGKRIEITTGSVRRRRTATACAALMGLALISSGVQAQTDGSRNQSTTPVRPISPLVPSVGSRPGLPPTLFPGLLPGRMPAGAPGQVIAPPPSMHLFPNGIQRPQFMSRGYYRGQYPGYFGGQYAGSPNFQCPVVIYPGGYFGVPDGAVDGMIDFSQFTPGYNPPDDGGLRNLNSPSLLARQHNPIDPGGLTNLNSPSLLAQKHNPIDPGGLTNLNSPSLLAQKHNPIDPGGLTRLNSPTVAAGLGDALRRFNHSREGYEFRYANGLNGRPVLHVYEEWGSVFFPGGAAFYPFYYPSYIAGVTCPSPYGYYFGVLPTYIPLDGVIVSPPAYDYVPAPVYRDGEYNGSQQDDVDGYYLNRSQQPENGQGQQGGYRVGEETPKRDVQLESARKEIERAWSSNDVQLIAQHIRPTGRIAVYLRGKYQYSIDASDYLDITRDALRSTKTVRFTLNEVTRKQNDVYTVTGTHVYTDKNGQEHTVHISYVLEKEGDAYYITQVGSAPDKVKQ